MTSTRPQTVDEMFAAQSRRRDIARLGAYAQHAKHDPRETTRGAFEARMRRYREQVDPSGELALRDPDALAKRVESALKADMAKVRLARSKRADEKRAALEKLRHTPSNQFRKLDDAATAVAVSVVEATMLGEELTTLEDLSERNDRRGVEKTLGRTSEKTNARLNKTEAAPVSAETAPMPHSSRKHPKIVSSGGGTDSIAPATRRRQTSTPTPTNRTSLNTSPKTAQKKAANSRDNSNTKRAPQR